MAYTVFSGFVMLWRLAGCPTRTSPTSVKATMEGVVRPPSAFSMTLALFPSITATQELVVPRSMPIAFAMTRLLVQKMGVNAFVVSDFVRSICGTRQLRREERRPARPAAAWGTQAAALFSCLASSLTSIFFGSDLAGFGIAIFRTPFDMVA